MRTTREELHKVDLQQGGITPPGILCIRFISEIPVRVLKQRIIDKPVYRSHKRFLTIFTSQCVASKKKYQVIYLNSRNQIIETLDLFIGTVGNIPVSPRQIVESAIRYRAASMIFVHNHPSGDPTPSKSNKQLTRDFIFIGSVLQIKILDHIIIGDNSHFSFNGEGLIEKYENNFLTLRIKQVLEPKRHHA